MIASLKAKVQDYESEKQQLVEEQEQLKISYKDQLEHVEKVLERFQIIDSEYCKEKEENTFLRERLDACAK